MTPAPGFLKSGHLPTLVAGLLYFDVSFMVWVLLGPLAPFLGETLGLSATEQGLLVAIPLLGGSLFRPVLGMLGDHIGGRRAGLIGLAATLVPLGIGWKLAHLTPHFYALGFLLGIAGASFAVALPLVSRWYPARYQGLAMGIAGAGNSGTIIATLSVPRLAERFGWSTAFALAIVPVLLVLVIFFVFAKDSPGDRQPPSWREYVAVVKDADTVWFSLLYGLTFGGFVGFASFLTTFFHEQYNVSKVTAGDLTTVVVVAGSLLRPFGGWLADRIGGYRLLLVLLGVAAACLFITAALPPLPVVATLLFVALGILGMANGAVFQLIPQRFPQRLGIVTGIVGAAGGVGGFFLPTAMGVLRDLTGSYAVGLLLFAAAFVGGGAALLELGTRWMRRWQPQAVRQSGIFCYRGAVRALLFEETA
jgi:NNP family nitrate/nitrite transporter-like MFS transporter